MRKIKFRVWRGKGMSMEYNIMAGFLGAFYVKGIDDKDSASMSPFNTIFDPKYCPVMQYTGLKDKNGKEIYEGDILGREIRPLFDKPDGSMEIAIVTYKEDQFIGDKGTSSETGIQYFIKNPHPYYIIGNRYENPELLPKNK